MKKAFFTDCVTRNKSYIQFTKQSLLDCIYYLIDNSYVKFGDQVYKQVIGIPMGISAGPHMANIYLHQYEHNYFNVLYESNRKVELAKLKNIFRFQDDLLALNDQGYLEEVISLIYPPEMVVNKTNIYRFVNLPTWIFSLVFIEVSFLLNFMINVMTIALT